MNIDPTEFGKAMGLIVREAIEPLARRVAELELLVKGSDSADVERLVKSILSSEDVDG